MTVAFNRGSYSYSLCILRTAHRNAPQSIYTWGPESLEFTICFLELRPYVFRSVYNLKAILLRCSINEGSFGKLG
jgi:hypothetical protein